MKSVKQNFFNLLHRAIKPEQVKDEGELHHFLQVGKLVLLLNISTSPASNT